MEKQLLVAIDGSLASSNILFYLQNQFHNLPDIKFHLLSIIPTTAADTGREWLDEQDMMSLISPECKRKFESAQRHLNRVRQKLKKGGFSAEQVTGEVRLSRVNIYKDILVEANRGLYDALVVGRLGADKISNMLLGSISAMLLEQSRDLPVWVIDGRVNSNKFLVPVDGTNRSLRAVEHLAFILAGNPYAEITLFNSEAVFAKTVPVIPEDHYKQWTKEWSDIHLSKPDSLFHAPEQLLIDNGFPREKIHRMTTRKGLYPSRQIVREALVGEYGTIVMGCRPKGISKGLFKSVTAKVCGMAEDVAVWIVECY